MAFRYNSGLGTAKAWDLKGYMLKVKETLCKFTNLLHRHHKTKPKICD